MGHLASRTDGSDRALSVAMLDSRLVDQSYATFASIYDRVWGKLLHAGRRQAILELDLQPGHEILEVGIGTGLTASLYPATCTVTGIDRSERMLHEAARNVAPYRNIRLANMDAQLLRFPDASFDVVSAAYVISAVEDPVAALREMRRVCRVGGQIVLLNHFLSANRLMSKLEQLISPVTARVGFRADVDLQILLAKAGLRALSVRKVNRPPIWSLVRCRREAA